MGRYLVVVVDGDVAVTGGAGYAGTRANPYRTADEGIFSRSSLTVAKGQILAFRNC